MKKAILSIAVISSVVFFANSNSGGEKVVICHQTGNGGSITIEVSENAVDAHLAHGDFLGVCSPLPGTGGNNSGNGSGNQNGGGDDKPHYNNNKAGGDTVGGL